MEKAAYSKAMTAETAIGSSKRNDTKIIKPRHVISNPIKAFLAISFPTVGVTTLTFGSASHTSLKCALTSATFALERTSSPLNEQPRYFAYHRK